MLIELPAELEKPAPDVDKIKRCEFLLKERIGDLGADAANVRKLTRQAKKIGFPMHTLEMDRKRSEHAINALQQVLGVNYLPLKRQASLS